MARKKNYWTQPVSLPLVNYTKAYVSHRRRLLLDAGKNVIFSTGQSNADDPVLGDTQTIMTSMGIQNPAYYECAFAGQPFRRWYSSFAFAEFMEGTETPIAVNTISKSGTTVTVNTTSSHGWTVKNYVLLANIDQSEYNTFWYITSASGTQFTFEVPSTYPNPTESTGTAKRAGVKEKFENDLANVVSEAGGANVKGLMWMQGRGNIIDSTIDEYEEFYAFLVDLKSYFDTTVAAINGVTIDPNFVISVGLTASSGTGLVSANAQNHSTIRRYQRDACAYKDYAYWAETLDLYRDDGIHIFAGSGKQYTDNFDEFRRRQIQNILQRENVPAKNGGDFDI